MPVIARFYGILIKMYFKEHGVSHFHAVYGEFNGVYDVNECGHKISEDPFCQSRSGQNPQGSV
jgi:hypothetical protein